MNHNLIDKQNPFLVNLFQRLEKACELLDKLKTEDQRVFHGERFITDSELSRLLRISRRTLQEYRTVGIIPYYLICGKVIYKESEIQNLLENNRVKVFSKKKLV